MFIHYRTRTLYFKYASARVHPRHARFTHRVFPSLPFAARTHLRQSSHSGSLNVEAFAAGASAFGEWPIVHVSDTAATFFGRMHWLALQPGEGWVAGGRCTGHVLFRKYYGGVNNGECRFAGAGLVVPSFATGGLPLARFQRLHCCWRQLSTQLLLSGEAAHFCRLPLESRSLDVVNRVGFDAPHSLRAANLMLVKQRSRMSWRNIGLSSGYLTVATVALAGLQWAIVILIAHFDGPARLGEYALAQAYATPAYYLASLSLRQQYLMITQQNVSLADFFFLRLMVPALVFSLLLAYIGNGYVSPSFFLVAAGVFAMKYVEGFFDLAWGKMQRVGDARGVATTSLTRILISLPLFIILYVATRNLSIALFALSMVWIGFFFVQQKRFDLQVRAADVFDLASRRLKHRLIIACHLIPLGVSLVVMSLVVYAPRFLLDAILGPKELGIFSAVSHFLTIGGIAAGAISQALLPSLTDAIGKHSIRKFWKLLLWPSAIVQFVSLVGVLAALLAGSELLRIFYGPLFASEGRTLVAATIAAGPLYCAAIVTTGCYAAQMRKGLLAIQCLALFVVIVTTLALTPLFGIDGAFAAMTVSAVTQIVASIALLVRFFSYRQTSLVQGKVGLT